MEKRKAIRLKVNFKMTSKEDFSAKGFRLKYNVRILECGHFIGVEQPRVS